MPVGPTERSAPRGNPVWAAALAPDGEGSTMTLRKTLVGLALAFAVQPAWADRPRQ
jgi:hypothetical protein